uniref:Uncharacterized protein n=1 Tax=Arcella intermedia TaxID=1963864 RepID=A0A6B2LPW4_9EUKA
MATSPSSSTTSLPPSTSSPLPSSRGGQATPSPPSSGSPCLLCTNSQVLAPLGPPPGRSPGQPLVCVSGVCARALCGSGEGEVLL